MTEIAKILGVELNERFQVRVSNTFIFKDDFFITEDGLHSYIENTPGREANITFISQYLYSLLKGDFQIIKYPFKPKPGDVYWSVFMDGKIHDFVWENSTNDMLRFYAENCFKSYEDIYNNTSDIINKIRGKYDGKKE